MWQNYRAEHEFIPISSAGGITFWLGNNPNAGGTLTFGGVISGEVADQHDEQLSVAERVMGHPLTSGQASKFWYAQGQAFIRKYPGRWIWVMWRKFRLFFSNEEVANVYAFQVERMEISVLRALFVPFAFIGALGLIGMVVSRRRVQAQPALMLLALGFASCMIFYTSSRFRLPTVPLWAILGGLGLDRAMSWYRAGHRSGAIAIAVAAATLTGLISWPVGEPLPLSERFGLRTMALMLARNGEAVRARNILAPQLEPNVPRHDRIEAYLMLGGIEMEQRCYSQGLEALQAAQKLDPKRVKCWLLIAECYMRQHKWMEAMAELHKGLEFFPQDWRLLQQLGQAHFQLHQYDRAAECFRGVLLLRSDLRVMVNLALCLDRLKRRAEARSILVHILAVEPDQPQAKALLRQLTAPAAP